MHAGIPGTSLPSPPPVTHLNQAPPLPTSQEAHRPVTCVGTLSSHPTLHFSFPLTQTLLPLRSQPGPRLKQTLLMRANCMLKLHSSNRGSSYIRRKPTKSVASPP